jgi:hypothetical protein
VNITVPDDTPPSLQCPPSFVIEVLNEIESYEVDFRKLRGQVNASDSIGDVAITFIPERATIRMGNYENVTVVASDKAGNIARCFFQVAVEPSPCVEWQLKPPSNGDISCQADEPVQGLKCQAVCNDGFRFTDGDKTKIFSCAQASPWIPSSVVPDCVSEDTTLSTYDVAATISYRANGAISTACQNRYISTVEQYTAAVGSVLTERCTAGSGNVDIQVSFKPTTGQVTGENSVDLTYVMMITPALAQPRVYDICGQTHDLIFDLSLQVTQQT